MQLLPGTQPRTRQHPSLWAEQVEGVVCAWHLALQRTVSPAPVSGCQAGCGVSHPFSTPLPLALGSKVVCQVCSQAWRGDVVD